MRYSKVLVRFVFCAFSVPFVDPLSFQNRSATKDPWQLYRDGQIEIGLAYRHNIGGTSKTVERQHDKIQIDNISGKYLDGSQVVKRQRRFILLNQFKKWAQAIQKRVTYLGRNEVLLEDKLESNDPFKLFKSWFQKADSNRMMKEPNAACLATATKDGVPSARFVLLKYFDSSGFTFFTNSESRKGRELEENPKAAMTFFWDQLDRSVRIEGRVEKVHIGESNVYFSSRPRNSQIGAHVSRQSTVISSRDDLNNLTKKIEAKYKDKEVPRPDYWNGYKIIPHTIEFWQGQSDRLHDRIQFVRSEHVGEHNKNVSRPGENGWVFYRLSP